MSHLRQQIEYFFKILHPSRNPRYPNPPHTNFTFHSLGRGQFGVVRKAFCKTTGKEFAIKIVPKKNLTRQMTEIQSECTGLVALNHPNIIKFYDIYETPTHFYEVMQLATGRPLLDDKNKDRKFSELEVAKIMKQALSAVAYLHKRGVVHRDLKPENFMYVTNEPNARLVLIDFGFCRILLEGESLKTMIGTPYYLAPELVEGYYDERCDYWSLGVMMHFLLVGQFPFQGDNTAEALKKIVQAPLKLSSKRWDRVSSHAKDLIRKLLNKDPNKRITADQALKHPWIQMADDISFPSPPKLPDLQSLSETVFSDAPTPKTTTDGYSSSPPDSLKISASQSQNIEEFAKVLAD